MSESWELITVSLSKDELKATINVPFMTDDGPLENPLLLDHARMALRRSGVIKGIKEDLLKSIFEDALFDKEILIAEGTAPQHGENARLEFFFETKREFEPPEDEDGRIDYKDVSLLNNVNKTDRLCRLHPPTAGKPGLTVTDKVIKPKAGMDRAMPGGANTCPSPDEPNLLLAATNGSVLFNKKSKMIEVQEKMEIKGDVDFNTGNIDFNGSLVVKDDIKTGFKVKVAGDLEVGGCVEDAEVEATGDILIKKGFIGRGDGIVRGGGILTVKYVQGQTLECEGDLEVGGEMMNAKARVNGNTYVSSRKGAIIGGSILCKGSVEATQIGNSSYTSTEVAVGHDFKLSARLEEIETELATITENQDKIKKGLYNLSRLKIQLKGQLPAEQEALMTRLQETLKHYPKQQEELEQEKKSIEEEIASHQEAYIQVKRSLFPGVKLTIGKFPRVFSEKFDGRTFRQIKGEIVPTS